MTREFTFRTHFKMFRVTTDADEAAVRIGELFSGYPHVSADEVAAAMADSSDAAGDSARGYHLDVANGELLRDDARRGDGTFLPLCQSHDIDDLLPVLEGDIYRQTLHAAEAAGAVQIHAAALARADGWALLVPGESGAGKSTLALALLSADENWSYLTDDLAFLLPGDAGTMVVGVPRLIGFSGEPAVAQARWPAGSSRVWVRYVSQANEPMREPAVMLPPSRIRSQPARLAAMVFPRALAANSATEWAREKPSNVARRLWTLVGDRSARSFAVIGELARTAPAFALASASPDAAVMAVAQMLAAIDAGA